MEFLTFYLHLAYMQDHDFGKIFDLYTNNTDIIITDGSFSNLI